MAFEISVPARFGDALVRNLMLAGEPFGIIALRHRGARRHAHREGPCRRAGAQRHDDGRRPRPRQDDVDQEGLYRPHHGRPRGADRARPRRLSSASGRSTRRAGCAPARISSRRARCPNRRPTRAMSPRSASRRCSTSGSGSACVARGRDRIGEIMRAHDPLRGEDYDVEICNPVFYDPEGGRQRG